MKEIKKLRKTYVITLKIEDAFAASKNDVESTERADKWFAGKLARSMKLVSMPRTEEA